MDITQPSRQTRSREIPLDSADFQTLFMLGDSMEPTICANDKVVYFVVNKLADDGIYVIRLDGHLKVKYIQRFAGGALHLISTNERYSPEVLTPVGGKDLPQLYHSKQSGLVGRLEVVGKVLFSRGPH